MKLYRSIREWNEWVKAGLVATAIQVMIGGGVVLQEKLNEISGTRVIPQVQPWKWICDENKDGNPDYTVIGLRGGPAGAITYLEKRVPTIEESNWYRAQEDR